MKTNNKEVDRSFFAPTNRKEAREQDEIRLKYQIHVETSQPDKASLCQHSSNTADKLLERTPQNGLGARPNTKQLLNIVNLELPKATKGRT